VPGEPAAKAGIQQGDVIVKVGGREVTPDETVSYLIANTSVGTRVPVELVRGGRRVTVQVQVGQRPTEEELIKQAGGDDDANQGLGEDAPVAPGSALGLSLQPLNAQIIRALNLPADQRGVVITSVDPGSDSAEKGLRRGDVIVSVNRQPVTQPQQVIAAVEATRRAGRSSVLLLVKRGQGVEAFFGIDISPQ
jgi:serine protease Do